MKKWISLVLVGALVLCALPALGEENGDDALMLRAVETLKVAWTEFYQQDVSRGMNLNGILDIRGARLIRFVENPPEPMSRYVKGRYGDPDAVDCVIEFTGYVDYFGGDDYFDELSRTAGTNCVVVLRSGEMIPAPKFFDIYTAQFYDQDFKPFMKEIVDFGDQYAGVYWLLGDGDQGNGSEGLDALK